MTTPQRVQQFLQTERICVLSVLLPNNSVHSAPLVYWYDVPSGRVYMSTDKNSEKMSWRREGKAGTQASLVIGGQEGLPLLVQMRGLLEAVDARQVPVRVKQAYVEITGESGDPSNATNTFIMFTPTWFRYSDWENDLTTQVK